MRSRQIRLAAAAAVVLGSAGLAAAPAVAKARPALTFRKPIFVDRHLAGSEGFVMYAAKSHRLIYVTHEGTTLLLRGGLTGAPSGDGDYFTTYRNQVNMWSSGDDGRRWERLNWKSTGFYTPPQENLGFSDPDLTEDGKGNIYAAGIDLANDALVSSADGGKTWPTGTVQCHEGDRPWLAGGRGREVFLATDSEVSGHIVVRSIDGGKSCSTAFANGQVNGWEGYGKLVYDKKSDTVYEAAVNGTQLGVMALRHATRKFNSGKPGNFRVIAAVRDTSFNTFWQAQIAEDAGGTLYIVWSTDARRAGTSGGCSGAQTPAANSVLMTYSTTHGKSWSKPVTVAHPGHVLVNWPWIVGGAKGRVAVAWYQWNKVVDLDCAPANAAMGVRVAVLRNAASRHPRITATDPIGRPMHYGPVCTSGTACVATGQDRRLGEFFTIAPDANGCVLIATGDTTLKDRTTGGPLPTARPLFTVQTSGPSLYGGNCDARAAKHSGATGSGGSGQSSQQQSQPSAVTAATRDLARTGAAAWIAWLAVAAIGVALALRRAFSSR